MTTSVEIVLGVWNALVIGGGTAAIYRRKQLLAWVVRDDNQRRDRIGSTDEEDAWEMFLAEHPELR